MYFLRLAALTVLVTAAPGIGLGEEFRSIDGTGNNLLHPEVGSAGVRLLRGMSPDYGDGMSVPSGLDRPGARAVSQAVCSQEASLPNEVGLTDFFWLFGQFVDHDINLTVAAFPVEPFDIPVPEGDPHFDPEGTGGQAIPMDRSAYDHSTGVGSPREQINAITAFIDASNVYGSDLERANALRTLDGTGRLKTSSHGHRIYLPPNTEGLPNAGGPSAELSLAGDVRANEHVPLTALHTLFVREHNHLVDEMQEEDPSLTGEELYQYARRIVGAQMQIITYNEFLPLLLGVALPPYPGYDHTIDPGITNEFSAAAYRFGHSMVSSEILRLKRNGKPIPAGNLPLRDAFFAPWRIRDEGGLEPLFRGLAAGTAQRLDVFIVDDLRNFLFGPPPGGFDLAALNIQRGRDHGLPDYNQARSDYELQTVGTFAEITSDLDVQARLEETYGDLSDLDLWVGILAEDKLPGALMGELGLAILIDQFRRLRDGDRFFYLNDFSPAEASELESESRLGDIIRRNTKIRRWRELPRHVFVHGSALRVSVWPPPFWAAKTGRGLARGWGRARVSR